MLRARKLAPDVRETLTLALPLILGQVAAVGMAATDLLFAGHLGERALAAVAVSLNFDVMVLVLMMGVFMASAAVIAQRRGAGASPAVLGRYIRSSLRLAVVLGVLSNIVILATARPVLSRLLADPVTLAMALDYLHVYACGSVSICLWYALRFAAEGVEGSGPVLRAGLVGLLVNAVVNPVLIHGWGPFPALGVAGSAWATVLAYTSMPLCLARSFRRDPALRALGLFEGRGHEAGAGLELLRIGLPTGLILIAEAALFVAVSVMMTRFGDTAVAAHQVALNLATILFMIPVGIGLATTVRVGYAVGAGNLRAARRAGRVGMSLGMANAGLNALVMMAAGGLLARCYTGNAQVVGIAASLLWVGGLFQLFDGVQTTANSALRGLSDHQAPMRITLFGFWVVGIPSAWWLGMVLGYGPQGLWWGLTAGIATVAVLLMWRFHQCTQQPVSAAPPEPNRNMVLA